MKLMHIERIKNAIENLTDSLNHLVQNEENMDLLVHNRHELVFLLETIDWKNQRQCEADEIYFLIEKDGQQEPVYFDYDEEENRWQELHCSHECREMPEEEISEYVACYYIEDEYLFALELTKTMYRDGMQHRIACYTCPPFLNGEFRVLRIMTEVECLDWMLEHEKKYHITDIKEFYY